MPEHERQLGVPLPDRPGSTLDATGSIGGGAATEPSPLPLIPRWLDRRVIRRSAVWHSQSADGGG